MKKKKVKVKFVSVGSKKEQEGRLSVVYNRLFNEAAERIKNKKTS